MDLVEYPLARKILHPCFKNTVINCSQPGCNKCMKGLFTLDCYDKLDEMSEVFDVSRYRNNHREYLVQLVKYKDDPFYVELYEIMLKKYPEEMAEAQKRYEKSITPVSRETYDTLVKAYDTTLLMLSNELPRITIQQWFLSKNIKKLYYVGESRFGGTIKSFIHDEVEIVTYKTGNVNDCDAVFIANVGNKDIVNKKNAVAKKLHKDISIYTINDIIKIFNNK